MEKTIKIISFCLYGSKRLYCEGAVKNLQLAQKIFPDWTCRFYVDESVPQWYRDALADGGVVITGNLPNNRMLWRVLPMFEDVICISRDTDSRLSEREKIFVDKWLSSDRQFHIIRDHSLHYSWLFPILGGLWGHRGKLPDACRAKMTPYSQKRWHYIDQLYLRRVIWPIARADCVIHGTKEDPDFLASRQPPHFIGQVYTENDHPVYKG